MGACVIKENPDLWNAKVKDAWISGECNGFSKVSLQIHVSLTLHRLFQ